MLVGVALWAGVAAEVAAQGSTTTDRAALEALYDATNGSGWADNTNWKTASPLGEWFGVTTDTAGRVTRLELPGNGLAGPIPVGLGELTLLRNLDFGSRWDSTAQQSVENTLTGPIPSELGSLVNLERLFLGSNALTGSIPSWLGHLTSLRVLSLGGNDLTGPIPSELGNLANLETLFLGSNALTGSIPSELGNLASLEWLSIESNALMGPIPSELGNLANLEGLFLGSNPLTGSLPQGLTRLSQLRTLDISSTGACAPATAEFQAWLETIADFRGDTCNRPPEPVGTIPPQALTESGPAVSVSMDAYFTDPDDDPLTYTAASGQAGTVTALASGDIVWLVPGSAGTATVTVTASDPDGLSATQPVAVTVGASTGPQSDREVLEVFYDSTGGESWTNRGSWKTSAPLDQWYGVTADAAGRVTELRLDDNGLAGPIPAALGDLARLEWLSLRRNDLVGRIPNALGRLTNLERLELDFNALTGPVPAWLGRLTGLRVLDLGLNKLSGPIPGELAGLADLEVLDLGFNALTGPVPAWLGRLTGLWVLALGINKLSGPIPGELGGLTNLQWLRLDWNDLSGPVPDELGRLTNLGGLRLGHNWGVTGELPPGLLELPSLDELHFAVTQACAPAAWLDRLAPGAFTVRPCESGADVTVDVAVVYTPAARDAAGGAAAIAAVIDLMVAETNQAYAASGVDHRLRLVEQSEVSYVETGSSHIDIDRLEDPSDGHMDAVHALRDRVGADLVHLVVGESDFGGIASFLGAFGLSVHQGGGRTFAHELGHNMGLVHDRYQAHYNEAGTWPHPAYGYVNQLALAAGAARSRRWQTIMAYPHQCRDAYTSCSTPLRFSNPRQRYNGDLLGVPFSAGGSGATGPADAAAVLNATGPAVALWRDPPARVNRPPAASGVLPARVLTLPGTLTVDVSSAFVDPDGNPLTYTVSSSAPDVVTVLAAGARVTLTAMGEGTATIRVTATDPGGLSAAQSFTVTVTAAPAPFTDDPIRPGVTPIKAVHFTELRARIDALRSVAGLAPFSWTDPVLRPGVTRVQRVHLLELRAALAEAYRAAGRSAPRWTDASPTSGSTPIRAAHVTELRAAVLALE